MPCCCEVGRARGVSEVKHVRGKVWWWLAASGSGWVGVDWRSTIRQEALLRWRLMVSTQKGEICHEHIRTRDARKTRDDVTTKCVR